MSPVDIIVNRTTGLPTLIMAVPIYQNNEKSAPVIGLLNFERDGKPPLFLLTGQ
jgi:hypothetical protein